MHPPSDTWEYLEILERLAESPAEERGTLMDVLARHPGREELAARAWIDLAAAMQRTAAPQEDGEERLGPYRLVGEIGRGGQGVVFRAEDTRVGRTVALKVLRSGGAATEQAVARFRREAVAASAVDHPGLCTVFDAGFDGDVPYIAMRFVDGRPLSELVAAAGGDAGGSGVVDVSSTALRGRRLAGVLELVEGVARALHAAHEAGFVHRDVKPGNIIVDAQGRGVVVDFGLTRAVEHTVTMLTRPGDALGTPPYMAPEQFDDGDRPIDRRTDVWSLGVVLYECVTARRPFEAPTRDGLIHAIRMRDPRPVRQTDPRLPAGLDAILGAALEKDPARRYRTAEALADDLAALREGAPVSVRPVSPLGHAVRWARRRPSLAATIALLLVAIVSLAAVGGYVLLKREAIETGEAAQLAERVDVLLQEGFLELGHGRGDLARAAFEAALTEDRDCAEAKAGLALAGARLRDEAGVARMTASPESVASIGAAGESEAPETAAGRFAAGVRALQRGHAGDQAAFAVAFEHLSTALLLSRGRRACYSMETVHAAIHVGEEERARLLSAELVAAWPDSPYAWYWHGYARLMSDPAAALESYDRAVALAPRLAIAHYHRALALGRLGRPDDVVEALEEAIAIHSRYGDAWRELGRAHERAGRRKEARAAYARAFELRPGDRYARALHGKALIEAGRVDEAADVLRSFADTGYFDVPVLRMVSSRLIDGGRLDVAGAILERAVADHPDEGALHRLRGVVHMRSGEADRAIERFALAARLECDNPDTAYTYGDLLMKAGRYAEAEAAMRELTARHPGFGPGWMQLALALTRRFEMRAAHEAFVAADAAAGAMPRWNPPSAEWVEQSRVHAELEADLERARVAGWDAADPSLRRMADLAAKKRLHVTAARMFASLVDSGRADEALLDAAARAFRAAASGEGAESALLDTLARRAWADRAEEL